ncbi:hypothetical protein LCGC14_0066760 [marine sediment metagenome]|uniref:N-acetyltransferase domain-containing protein n=1 Tax=marine sediment metagenome TaxID=412755 RepID=A0A0F9Y356_9ZZZZ|nr:GNAT family N-acetyltransferase [Maribacter sp.]HDZ05620.1 N-acetyltransferase [Maribacter sp.]
MDDIIQFEVLQPQLYKKYIELGTKAYNQHYRHLWPYGVTDTYIENSFTNEVLLNEEQNENTILYLIKINIDYVGILKITLHKQIHAYSKLHALYLDKIYILKEYSGKGIGTKSLLFVENIAKKHLKRAVFLESMQKGPALQFYINNHFTIVDTTKVPFSNVIEEEKPMYLLKKDI